MKAVLVKLYNQIYPYIRHFRFNLRYHFRVMTPEKTTAYIKKTGCSIARFGDGEFGIITKTNSPDFQRNDNVLVERLTQVCIAQDPRILVCIPHSFKTTRDCNDFARKFWEWWLWENNNLESIAKLLKLNSRKCRIFGDAQITRPYMDWKDKRKAAMRFEALKTLWQDQDVLILEGAKTKLGVGNDLLSRTRSIQRILAPAKNAFSLYDEILAVARRKGAGKLVLLALGPTATVLAYDLALANIQALDIGHIDIEYEWFLQRANQKTAVMGKATQESHTEVHECTKEDQEYLSQIIMRIGC